MTAAADALMAIFGFKRVEGSQMKTDRELLELAAKAAGIVGVWHERGQCIHVTDCEGMSDIWWRPLTDDGDALRLGAKLLLDVYSSEACIVAEDGNGVQCIEYMYGPEDYASGWRRAIVRAAAAIGEAMQ